MQQRSDAWLKVRGGKITGSRFARAMSSKQDVYRKLIDQLVEERRLGRSLDSGYVSAAMQWGIDHEPLARKWYSARGGHRVQEVAFVPHRSMQYVGVSPDGLVGHDGLIEIKCPQLKGYRQTLDTRRVPSQYYWQIQGGLWVCERDWADYVCFYPPGQGLVIRVQKDENEWDRLASRCKEINGEVERRLRTKLVPRGDLGLSGQGPTRIEARQEAHRQALADRKETRSNVTPAVTASSTQAESRRLWWWLILAFVFVLVLYWL